MQIRLIRATFNFAVILLAFCCLAGNSAWADQSLRIARPRRYVPVAAPAESTGSQKAPADVSPAGRGADVAAGDSCCGAESCGDSSKVALLTSALPSEGLFIRWRNEFVNPTMCPIRLCHGSCAKTSMGCKNIKTMIDSLLDAYIPEEQPIQAVLNFRCCAGFTDE